MDSIDYKILKCLKENARENASAISQQVNLSVSAVIERIKKLESAGIIEKYTVVLNQKLLGNTMLALMEVSLEHPKFYDSFTEKVKKHENIASCYYITGDFDFMLKIVTDSSEGLEKVHRDIKCIEGVSLTKTHFVLSGLKNDFSPLPIEHLS